MAAGEVACRYLHCHRRFRVRHNLVTSEYNTRHEECNEAVRILKKFKPSVKALRDASLEDLEAIKEKMPENGLSQGASCDHSEIGACVLKRLIYWIKGRRGLCRLMVERTPLCEMIMR
jgi:galactokinase